MEPTAISSKLKSQFSILRRFEKCSLLISIISMPNNILSAPPLNKHNMINGEWLAARVVWDGVGDGINWVFESGLNKLQYWLCG